MQTSTLVLIFLIPTGIILLSLLVVAIFNARQRAAATGIPPSRRPGPTDEALEGPVLERYQAWGLVFTAFLAIFLPALYLYEPTRQAEAKDYFLAQSRDRGHATFEQFCARCHGTNAQGGEVKRFKRPDDPDAEPADYPVPDLTRIYERHPNERVADVATTTINQGREGTPMPAWGVRYNGAMNDQQIADIVNWLLTIQADKKPREPVQFKQ
jgi:mono/diheme cytochrome c family protein